MTPECRRTGSALYEVTVEGSLGAMFRALLQPYGECVTQTCTSIRVNASAERDLVDLVRLLASKGLRVEGVFKVFEGGSR